MDSLILTAFKLLNEPKNLIIDGREINDDTNIRVNDHADNVMALSYYANQMVEIFLLDSFFAIVYLSFLEESVLEDEFMDRFRFLLQLLEKEFVLEWDLEEVIMMMFICVSIEADFTFVFHRNSTQLLPRMLVNKLFESMVTVWCSLSTWKMILCVMSN